MTNRFMISVAAVALIAGTGFANAQGTGMSKEGTSSGSSVQQSAPSSSPSSATPTNRNEMNRSDTSDKGAAKTTQSEEKMRPGGAKSQRAQDDMKAGQRSEKSAQENMKGEKSKSMSSENEGAKAGKDMKAEGREGRDSKMNAQGREDGNTAQGREDRNTAQGREDRMNAEQKGAVGTHSETTTGQVGASAKLAPEQRTKITTVIREQHVQPAANVNFEIRTGVRVPRDVKFYPLPQEVVTIYPQWRGYEFILVNDKIVVVDPRTFEIVDVLDA
jgi:Protein of unknown function (DUF1236)